MLLLKSLNKYSSICTQQLYLWIFQFAISLDALDDDDLIFRNENENEPSRRWVSRYLQRPTKKGCPLMSAYRVDIYM